MALLGAQLVLTLVMVSIIQKLSPYFSLAKWLLCSTGLVRYLHPTDDELKTLAGVPKDKGSKSRQRNGHGRVEYTKPQTFHVNRNIDVQLETAKITPFDVIHLRYFTEYQWLVDFSLYSIIVYTLSEVYHYFVPLQDEVNLSMLWCLLVIFFAFKLLISLTVQYFRSEESIGERSTCIVTGLTYLLIAMMVLIVPESTLEVGLDQAYKSFNHSASTFMSNQGLNSSGPASQIVVKFCIAVSCGLLGALFTFPGLRMARMHWDSMKYCEGRKSVKFLLNLSFALPFILIILWIKPVSRNYLTVHVFSGMEKPLLSSESFETMRLGIVIFAVFLRFALMPIYLQTYLNLAYQRIEDQKKEAGRITNIDYQKKITSIFYYLCVVTLQYAAPILMCLFFTLMYKTLGDFKWSALLVSPQIPGECSADPIEEAAALAAVTAATTTEASFDAFETIADNVNEIVDDANILSTAEHFQMSFKSLKNVFTTEVYRGIFGFATWWSCFVWFGATSLGMVYQSYFVKS